MTLRTLVPALLLASGACVAPPSSDSESVPVTGATTIVSLTFDDTLADQYQVAAMLAQRGLVATFYVNSSRPGTSGYMTRNQLLSLQDAGNEIAGHTITHANLVDLSATQARRQVCDDRVALLDSGFRITTFAYPFGANNSAVNQIVAACGYNAARDVGGLVTPGSCSSCPYANTVPPAEPYALRTSDSVKSNTTLATLQRYVTQAEDHGGGFVPIVIHHVCNGCSTDSISPTTLAAFMDWLAARGPATQVTTVDDVIGGDLKPGVPASSETRPPNLAISCNGTTCASTNYPSAVTVSLDASDSGSGLREVRYTLDGSDPATGTLYGAPFSVSTSSTVRALAIDNANNQTTRSVTIAIGATPPPPTNLLQNASLETDADGNGIPDCWKRDGYGTNTATYTLVAGAFAGAVAQQLDITSWSSGGRRLASAQDSGACAPAATPGRRYQMTGYYKASAQPRFSVFYRNTAGSWNWFAESALLPTSSTYVQATFTTPVLPADATALSIGLSLFGAGSLTTDAYTLVEL